MDSTPRFRGSAAMVAAGLCACLLPAVGAAAPFDVHDLLALQRISDAQVSPDGTRVAFVVRSTDLEANRGRTDIWAVDLAGGAPRQLTDHEAADVSPRWAADGRSLYFLSGRSGSQQVWRMPAGGGPAEAVTALPLDVQAFRISPDGQRLALALAVDPACEDLACSAPDTAPAPAASGRHYDRLFVRHWDTWEDGTRNHLHVFELADGRVVDLQRGMAADSPSRPFGGDEEFTFTPDSRGIVFSARIADDREAWSTNFDLWYAPVDGSAAPRNLTPDNPAWDTQPVFSPDGRTLASLAMAVPGYESDRFRIVLREGIDGPPRVLTESWDRSPSSLSFTPDGEALLVTAQDLGRVSVFRVSVTDGTVEQLTELGTHRWPQIAGDRIVVGRERLAEPLELFSLALDGSDPQPLTRINAELLAGVDFGESEPFTFEGAEGDTVHGWLLRPANFDPQRRYPVAYLIHGGPQGSFGDDFHYRWSRQIFAAAGYATVTVDFHGSTGYGQAFTDSIGGDWGGKPLVDLQRGLAAVLDRNPWMDGERVCALGASYGGFMVHWIAGQWPDRFRCLVNHDGVFDQRSMYYSTEELWFPEREFGGPYWEAADHYERFNPARFVDRWQTPMLVVHGEQDFRVPLEQGLAAFTALQRRGIPSELLVFPDENHWVLKPANSIQWHEVVLAWLARWTTEGDRPAATPDDAASTVPVDEAKVSPQS